MMYALAGGVKSLATPYGRGVCPGCGATLLAKCGEINAWHWSHTAGPDCDGWFEPESAWHLAWKAMADPECVEVVVGRHRADIAIGGCVIELQHSSLSPAEVREREAYYGRMAWVVDAAEFSKNLSIRNRGSHVTFRWCWPRKWMNAITRPLYWDFRDGRILHVRRLHVGAGWGVWLSRDEFCQRFNLHWSQPL